MTWRSFSLIAVLTSLLAGIFLSCAMADPSRPRIDPADLKNIMLVKDVKPGMKGYGKTVFRGTKIETFGVEVLGVMKKVNAGSDMVLVKLSGGPMTSRGANLIQGMSGSPIYINGKILGAFSMGEAFLKEPIGMVTPIENMFDAWDPKLPGKPGTFFPFSTGSLEKPVSLSGRNYSRIAIDYGDSAKGAFDKGTLVFRPLSTPFFASGFSSRTLARMHDELGALNIHPVAGPGPATDYTNLDIKLEPGAGVAVSLVTGDMDMTGVGTVTYRRGNKILAFGHPMLGIGTLEAPLSTAYVFDVTPSVYVSSKMAGPVKPVGSLTQDRPWSISGEIGKTPEMIPVTIHISDKSLGCKRDFRVQVIKHPALTGQLIGMSASEAILQTRPAPMDAVARVKFQVEAEEVGAITRENTFFDPMGVEDAAVSELSQVVRMLQYNQFHPVGVKKVEIWVDMESAHPTAKLERIFLKKSKFEPGETVEIGAVLRPFKGEKITKTISLPLPKNMPTGRMMLQVGKGGQGMSGMGGGMSMMGGGDMQVIIADMGDQQPMPSPDNLRQVIDKFLEKDRNNELTAKIVLPKPVPSIAGQKLSGLPPAIAEAMRSSRSTAIGMDRDEVKTTVPTDWFVIGGQRLSITVSRKEKSEKKLPSPRGPEMPPPGGPDGPPMPHPVMEDMGDEFFDVEMDAASEDSVLAPMILAVDDEDEVLVKAEPKPADAKPGKPGEEKKPGNKPDARKEPEQSKEKPVIRTPATWKQTLRADFMKGTCRNVLATTGDLLEVAGSLQPLCEVAETYVWSILPDGKGGVYAGTGNKGIIYKIAADGKSEVLHDSDELEIHSLAMDSAGNVYAGTSPNGTVLKIGPDGKAAKLLDADEKYIVALASDSNGNLYAAAGDRCKVYRILPSGEASVLLETPETYALSLAVDKDDNVYLGTGTNGLVYKVTPSGEKTIAFDANEDSVTALGFDAKGSLFVGTGAKGAIYKLSPGAAPKSVYDKAGTSILAITADASGNVYALNTSSVFRIAPDDTVAAFDNESDTQYLCAAARDNRLYIGAGNVGAVYSAGIGGVVEGSYESPVHDCSLQSKWGVISWTADLPAGTSLTFQTRTGNSAEPDSTWSDWSTSYTASGQKVISPAARYIQYRAVLTGADACAAPKLKDVSLVYLPENQAPKVTITSPKGGEKWSKKQNITWNGMDPDKDTLTYEVFYSADGGTTWTPLKDKIESKPESKPEPAKTDGTPKTEGKEEAKAGSKPITLISSDPDDMLAEMKAELANHPEIPQEVKDQIMSEASVVITEEMADMEGPMTPMPGGPEKPGESSTKQTDSSWDTSKVNDGAYLIKVVATDRLSNPTDARTGEAVSESLVVSNETPKVVPYKKTLVVGVDKTASVEGSAFHKLIGISGVQYRIDEKGDWAAAAPVDGIFDSSFESFKVVTQPLEKGEHTIELKAIDQTGASASTKLKAKVE